MIRTRLRKSRVASDLSCGLFRIRERLFAVDSQKRESSLQQGLALFV